MYSETTEANNRNSDDEKEVTERSSETPTKRKIIRNAISQNSNGALYYITHPLATTKIFLSVFSWNSGCVFFLLVLRDSWNE